VVEHVFIGIGQLERKSKVMMIKKTPPYPFPGSFPPNFCPKAPGNLDVYSKVMMIKKTPPYPFPGSFPPNFCPNAPGNLDVYSTVRDILSLTYSSEMRNLRALLFLL